MYSTKVDSPNYIEFSKSRKKWEIWLVPKILQGEKYFEPCYQLLKTNDLDNLKSPIKSIVIKNKEKHYWQYGIVLFTMLKILDSYIYMKPNLAKIQLWIKSSTSVKEYVKQQHTT